MNTISTSDYLSKENTDCLKGYLAIMVLISHLYQFSELMSGTNIGNLLNMFGHYGVISFMFLSGFGLCTSYLCKGRSYIKTFPKHRILPFFIVYCISILTYFIFETAIGNKITALNILESLTFGNTIVSFGWYLQLTLWLYIAFWIICLLPIKDSFKSVVMGIAAVAYVFIKIWVSAPLFRAVPVISFIFGFIVAYYKKGFTQILVKAWYLLSPVSLLFLAVYFKVDYAQPSKWVQLIFCLLSDFAFITLVLLLMYFCNNKIHVLIKNHISVFLGKYSLEIYIIQALILRLFKPLISNVYIYLAVSAVLIIVLSIPYHFIISKVSGLPSRLHS